MHEKLKTFRQQWLQWELDYWMALWRKNFDFYTKQVLNAQVRKGATTQYPVKYFCTVDGERVQVPPTYD